MDKLRKRLLMCLVIIFIFTAIGFTFAFLRVAGVGVTGASVLGNLSAGKAVGMFLPGLLFIGLLIMTVWYLER